MVVRPFFLLLKSVIIVNKGMFIMLTRNKNKKEEQITIEDAPKGFVYKKSKRISKKKLKRQNTITTLLFLIGFILPTALAIYKKSNMDTTNAFEKYYFYVFIGLIVLRTIFYKRLKISEKFYFLFLKKFKCKAQKTAMLLDFCDVEWSHCDLNVTHCSPEKEIEIEIE